MKVIALTDCMTQYHSFWVRVGQYLQEIAQHNYVEVTYDHNSINTLRKGDVLIFYRYSLEWGDLSICLGEARKSGVKVISDIDDYLWYDGERRGWSKERLRLYTKALKECTLITCSTNYLGEQLAQMFRKQVIITLNNSAPALITKKKRTETGKIRIGWTGAPWTRPYDLEVIKPLGKWVERNNDKVELIHIGHSERFMSLSEALGINPKFVQKIELCGHKEYMTQFNFDVGLAPLQDNCFNSFKSAIKVIEYSANEIPWLASNTRIYRSLCEQWSWKGRLCDTEEDWIKNIEQLLDECKRIEEGKLLREKCEQYSSHSLIASRWNKIILD